jgi:hypothetical protein
MIIDKHVQLSVIVVQSENRMKINTPKHCLTLEVFVQPA